MKKIYTLIAAVAVCASLNAQTYFKVTCGNKVVKAGDTCISKIFDDWGGGWGQYSSDLKVEVLEELNQISEFVFLGSFLHFLNPVLQRHLLN